MGRLLIIDDEPGIARIVHKVATGFDYDVIVTATAEQFMNELAAQEPEVIVLDLAIPGTDGVELLRALASKDCSAKIIIISGFDARVLETSGRLGSALGLSIAGTLGKPIRVAALKETFEQIQGSLPR